MPRKKRNKTNQNKNTLQTIFIRYMFIVAIFIFWIAAIGVRLVHLQVNQHQWLRKQALEQRQVEFEEKLPRGTIFDRNNRRLAMSVDVKSLYADPTKIEDIEATVEKISKIISLDKKTVINDLQNGKENNRQFIWIARKLSHEDFEKVNETLVENDIKKYDLPKFTGLHWQEEQQRKYPNGNLASHILGFTNSEQLGLAGVEMSQETVLQGKTINQVRERDRLGRVYEQFGTEAEPSKDVVLTISHSIQYKTEEALAKGTKSVNAKAGKVVVLDAKNGEILAMANNPSFDPNDFRNLDPKNFNNRAIQDNYTPGSVFKLVTYGAALEENLIQPNDNIDCGNGEITVAGHLFKDSHSVGSVSYTTAMAHSSNVGAIKTGLKVGKEKFYEYARKFGFGEKTNIQLPAEANGILRSPEKWNGDSLASMSIGYEIGVTALQSAVAFATIANDGIKVQPHIIKEIRQSDGKVISEFEPESVRVVSEKTASDLRKMLRQVVLDGTAKSAQLRGYTSAGKTGTAWKYDASIKAINKNKYVSSFVGYAPADNPRIVIAVIIDEPQGAFRNGGQVAAPIFREIAEQVLPELNVSPDGSMPEVLTDDEEFETNENPDLIDSTTAENEESTDEENDKVEKQKSKKDEKKKSVPKEKATTADKKGLKDRNKGKREDQET